MSNQKWLWIIPLFIIFVLSQDYWNWSSKSVIGFSGFPNVVWYFFILQLFFAFFIWIFTKKYWQE